jgi:hypothetical protein
MRHFAEVGIVGSRPTAATTVPSVGIGTMPTAAKRGPRWFPLEICQLRHFAAVGIIGTRDETSPARRLGCTGPKTCTMPEPQIVGPGQPEPQIVGPVQPELQCESHKSLGQGGPEQRFQSHNHL